MKKRYLSHFIFLFFLKYKLYKNILPKKHFIKYIFLLNILLKKYRANENFCVYWLILLNIKRYSRNIDRFSSSRKFFWRAKVFFWCVWKFFWVRANVFLDIWKFFVMYKNYFSKNSRSDITRYCHIFIFTKGVLSFFK